MRKTLKKTQNRSTSTVFHLWVRDNYERHSRVRKIWSRLQLGTKHNTSIIPSSPVRYRRRKKNKNNRAPPGAVTRRNHCCHRLEGEQQPKSHRDEQAGAATDAAAKPPDPCPFCFLHLPANKAFILTPTHQAARLSMFHTDIRHIHIWWKNYGVKYRGGFLFFENLAHQKR